MAAPTFGVDFDLPSFQIVGCTCRCACCRAYRTSRWTSDQTSNRRALQRGPSDDLRMFHLGAMPDLIALMDWVTGTGVMGGLPNHCRINSG